jgi:hypothetical protein
MTNPRIARTALLLVLAAVALVGCRQPDQDQVAASPDEKRDYLGGTEAVSLYLVRHEENRWLELDTSAGVEKLFYRTGAVLPDGSLLLGDLMKGMFIRHPDGRVVQLLAKGRFSGEVHVDSAGHHVAYIYPLVWDEEFLDHYGVGLYDLETNEAQLLASDPARPAAPLGWFGDRIVFWWTGGEGPLTTCCVDLEGDIEPLGLPTGVTRFLGVRHDKLVYETFDKKTVVWDLVADTKTEFAEAENARWTRDGVEATLNGQRQVIYEMRP